MLNAECKILTWLHTGTKLVYIRVTFNVDRIREAMNPFQHRHDCHARYQIKQAMAATISSLVQSD